MKNNRILRRLVAVVLASWLSYLPAIGMPAPVILAEGGGTDYVLTGNLEEADIELALGELAEHLKAATGADFRTVTVAEAEQLSRRIVVGDNALSRSILGEEIVDSLDPQESFVAVKGQDLVLVGGNPRASLYAAYSFLENDIGCRWYALHLDPVIRKHDRLIVPEATRREQPAFSHRYGGFTSGSEPQRGERFVLRNRLPNPRPRGKMDPGAHTLFYYIPPHEQEAWYKDYWGVPPRSNLFEANPEFFSMTASSQRVDNLQLCFSNPELRRVLTSQIDSVISQSKHGDHGYISVDANDVPGKFCHCPGCLKLEEKYDNIGGPLYDYLLELSGFLKREHPGVVVKTLAYRKKQTEFPPEIEKLPDNIVVHFAPIDDNFAAGLGHPTNRETLENLKGWCKIAETVWVWYYANPFIAAGPPFAVMRRTIDDLRTMLEAGVEGVTFQRSTGTTDQQRGLNFADLQAWLLMRLSYDPHQDAEALIDEFMTHYYGEAAPLMTTYLAELESLREAMAVTWPHDPSPPMFTYVTPAWLARWEPAFDEMEKLTAMSADALRHVRTARIGLDTAFLQTWPRLAEEPRSESGMTPGQLADRIKQNMTAELETRCRDGRPDWCLGPFEKRINGLLLRAQVTLKPLPAPFASIPPDRIREILPDVTAMTEDVDAASGLAVVREDTYGGPLRFGLYDNYNEKERFARAIEREEIRTDRYHVYRLGRAVLSPRCRMWMTDAWVFTIALEEAYVEGDPLIEWDIYASLKFAGPKYGSEDKDQPNRISCDRVVLVRVETDGK